MEIDFIKWKVDYANGFKMYGVNKVKFQVSETTTILNRFLL